MRRFSCGLSIEHNAASNRGPIPLDYGNNVSLQVRMLRMASILGADVRFSHTVISDAYWYVEILYCAFLPMDQSFITLQRHAT